MAARYEAQLITVMQQQFNRQREAILANLDSSRINKSYTRKDWLSDLIDWAMYNEDFRQAIQPTVHAVLLEAGQEAMQQVGRQPSTYDPFSPALTKYFQERSTKIATDVDDETAKQIRASLNEGVLEHEGPTQLRARVENVMGNATTYRADRIARTEVTRAQGYADIEAWRQSGVVSGKEWFTAEDEHVCPFCDDLDHQVYGLDENFFDKGDTLKVGDQKQDYNYDDVTSPPLHVNCRCVLLPVRG